MLPFVVQPCPQRNSGRKQLNPAKIGELYNIQQCQCRIAWSWSSFLTFRDSPRISSAMECRVCSSTYLTSQFDGGSNNTFFNVQPHNTWIIDLARLRNERDILENGLANCVTYLHVLRKKQARNERLLNLEPARTRKKRKKIQQNKRELDREIRNRQRDEEAFLSNLQVCKANIDVAEGYSYVPTNLSSIAADCTWSSTQWSVEEFAPTEISWNGWMEGAITSPFDKKRSDPFSVYEFAPDELAEPDRDTIVVEDLPRPLPVTRSTRDVDVLPVPPNTVYRDICPSLLSPEAATFEPSSNFVAHIDDAISPTPNTIDSHDTRRCTEAGICRSLQQLSLDNAQYARNHTWCQTTPQRTPTKDFAGGAMQKSRTSSL
jgi:hypothetical protein